MINLQDIDYLGIDRVLERGTGEIIEQEGNAVFVFDTVSEGYFLGCSDYESGLSVYERHAGRDIRLLMVSDIRLGKYIFETYGFADRLECYQLAYYGEMPKTDSRLLTRTAEREDLPFLTENYHLISASEMEKVVERGSMLLGYRKGQCVGFIGEHLEGSLGLLYVFPEFRRRGYAEELEKSYIARTMKKGFTPFGQVERTNTASLKLQEKIGLVCSENLICWMWK